MNKVKCLLLLAGLVFSFTCCGSIESSLIETERTSSNTEISEKITDIIDLEGQAEENESYSADSIFLDDWLGYYTFHGTYPKKDDRYSGYISMDLIIYQEDKSYLGYLNMNGSDDTYEYYHDRILVEIQGTQDMIQIFFVESYGEEDRGDMFDAYSEGIPLFSLKKRADGLLTEWENLQLDLQEKDIKRGFIQQEDLVSVVLRNSEDKKSFLRAFSIMDETVPFYQYYMGDDLYLELYYDTEKTTGVGVFYGNLSMCGFNTGAYEIDVWQDHKFSVMTEEYNASSLAEYEEYYTYDEAGKLIHFYSEGIIEEWVDSPYLDKAVDIEFFYRKDGTLERKKCFFNPCLFGTTRSTETYFYDSDERLVFVSAYITHGALEDYYIYEGKNKEPSYHLILDHMGWNAWPISFIQYINELSILN